MKRTKVTLTAQTIITLEIGTHEAVRDGGNLYVLLQQEEGEPEPVSEKAAPKKEVTKKEEPKKEKEEKEDEVVDDTKSKKAAPKKKKAASKSKAKSKAKEEEEDEDDEESEGSELGEEIPQEEWENLEDGEVVKVVIVLDDDDPDAGKVWLAKVAGWKKPKGGTEKALFVTFDEDGETDFLREGDKVYTHSVDL